MKGRYLFKIVISIGGYRPGQAWAVPGLKFKSPTFWLFCCRKPQHVLTCGLFNSTMTQERLFNLALLYIERDVSRQLQNSLDSLVVQFAEKFQTCIMELSLNINNTVCCFNCHALHKQLIRLNIFGALRAPFFLPGQLSNPAAAYD